MRRFTRRLHKWLGIGAFAFILLVSLTAIALNHPEWYALQKEQPVASEFGLEQANVLAQDPFDYRHFLAADHHHLYQSLDQGDTWQEVKLYFPAEHVSAIVFSPQHRDHIWLNLEGVGLFYSEDAGEIWEEIDLPYNPLEGEHLKHLAVDQNHLLLAQTQYGVYQLQDEAWRTLKKAEVSQAELTVKDWLWRLHTGQFWRFGPLLYDFLAGILIVLSITGLYLSWRPKKKARPSV